MPRKNSLSRTDFKALEAVKLRREHGNFFALSWGALPSLENGPKIACIISKKTAHRAVDRNLVKRRCRAAARQLLSSGKVDQVFIFTAKHTAARASFKEIKQDVTALIAKSLHG